MDVKGVASNYSRREQPTNGGFC